MPRRAVIKSCTKIYRKVDFMISKRGEGARRERERAADEMRAAGRFQLIPGQALGSVLLALSRTINQ